MKFKVTFMMNSGKIVLKNVAISEDPNVSIDNDGTITLGTGFHVLNLMFEPISDVKKIRIDVIITNAFNGNLVLNEIEINP